ncbi:hypothetical protein J6590_011612, partial [Homalodisca vitripennis]
RRITLLSQRMRPVFLVQTEPESVKRREGRARGCNTPLHFSQTVYSIGGSMQVLEEANDRT